MGSDDEELSRSWISCLVSIAARASAARGFAGNGPSISQAYGETFRVAMGGERGSADLVARGRGAVAAPAGLQPHTAIRGWASSPPGRAPGPSEARP